MKGQSWLFRKLNLSLRWEIITNISLLMLVAILLIGFTISKMNERNVIQEKVRYGEGMVKDFQAIMDFISRDRPDLQLKDPAVREELLDFVALYAKGKGFLDLVVVDPDMKMIAANNPEGIDLSYSNDELRQAIQTGLVGTEVKRSGGFLSTEYERLILYAPLWVQGRTAGGIQMDLAIGDVMTQLLKSQRIILLSIILDAIILVAFGSFLLSRVLVKPLQGLVQLTQKISEGDFNEKIEGSSTNEIGQLIASFNRMIERLKANREELEDYVTSLEVANKQLKQAQEELIRTEKLASIGRFAAGVAHEVGNPLGAILGYTSMLEKGQIEPGESKDYLQRIEKEIQRINRIVRELLDFSRPSKGEIREVEVNKVLENTLSLLSYQKSFRNVETQLDLHPDLPRVLADESQLSQVFLNMMLNAVDAMPEGGILRIQTEPHVVEDAFADQFQRHFAPRRRGDPVESDYFRVRKPDPLSAILAKFSRGDLLAKIRISDTGTGIKKEDLKRIFDPFFTTKSPDKGTGLGLSICLRIVESVGGVIRVESEGGQGATFEIYLPGRPAASPTDS
jgi:two-component system NtrC family sensor kinase